MPKRLPIVRVSVEGRSWHAADEDFYCFDAVVDGKGTELRVAEDVAFDLLGAWTRSQEKCLNILRLHRADLAKNLEHKISAVGYVKGSDFHLLTLRDIERTNPVARDEARSNWPNRR
jgi:hypothetical protein